MDTAATEDLSLGEVFVALDAGFDGVEVHVTNGNPLEQFLCDGVNRRIDSYGGPPRAARLHFEVMSVILADVD